ncbi:MAG: MGMT family protein [Nannocystaceae bacterium]
MSPLDSRYQPYYDAVCHIPSGHVATYGQVAEIAGRPGRARQVGYALHALPPDTDVPWHRVVNTRGEISLATREGRREQRRRLRAEGVVFGTKSRIDLERFGA